MIRPARDVYLFATNFKEKESGLAKSVSLTPWEVITHDNALATVE